MPDDADESPYWAHDEWTAWAATTWPHDAEHFLVERLRLVLRGTGGVPDSHWAKPILDALASHPGRIGRLAACAVAAGLSGGTPEIRIAAADATLALVPTGRLPAPELARAMTTLMAMCTSQRWTRSLTDVATASAAGGTAVIEVLTYLLPELPADRPGLNGLVELLHQEMARRRLTVTDPALRAWCNQLSGSSKTARAARGLLALT